MDKINALYEELLSYDSSLSQNKERVLQLIQKMVAAKPTLVISEQWKKSFAEKLSDHIEASKVITQSSRSWFVFSRRSVSVLSTFIVLTLAGASYFGLRYRQSAKINIQNPQLHVEQSLNDSQEVDGNTEVANRVKDHANPEPLHSDDSISHTQSQRDIASVEMKQSALSNSQTVVQFAKNNPIAYDAVASEEVDLSTSVNNEGARMMMESESAVGGGVDAVAPVMSATSLAKTAVEQKVIALVIIDASGTGMSSGALEMTVRQDLPVTYVRSKESLVATHFSGGVYALSEKTIATISADLSVRNVIVLEKNYVSTQRETFEQLVKELKAEGYVFVSLSFMQQ